MPICKRCPMYTWQTSAFFPWIPLWQDALLLQNTAFGSRWWLTYVEGSHCIFFNDGKYKGLLVAPRTAFQSSKCFWMYSGLFCLFLISKWSLLHHVTWENCRFDPQEQQQPKLSKKHEKKDSGSSGWKLGLESYNGLNWPSSFMWIEEHHPVLVRGWTSKTLDMNCFSFGTDNKNILWVLYSTVSCHIYLIV